MPAKKRSDKEFQAFLHELFDKDNLKVKYKNPDGWRYYKRVK